MPEFSAKQMPSTESDEAVNILGHIDIRRDPELSRTTVQPCILRAAGWNAPRRSSESAVIVD